MIKGENLEMIRQAAEKSGWTGYIDTEAVDLIIRYSEVPVNWAAFSNPDQPLTLFMGRPIYVYVHGYWLDKPTLKTEGRNRPRPLHK